MSHFLKVILASFAILSAAYSVNAQDTRVYEVRFNPIMKPDGVYEFINECAANEWCKDVVKRVAEYYGVSPAAVDAAATVLEATYNREGEETRFYLNADSSGDMRAFCRATLEFDSVAGRKTPSFSIAISAGALRIYGQTPKLQIGEGRTWIDAVLVVEDVPRPQLEDLVRRGRCTIPIESGNEIVYHCKGRAEGGRPKCSGQNF
ncbi:MAG: hypothetical protein RDA78_03035 [Roseibium sp.]|uniref:hypothetical protein n=1 Tax=Roseibium sp. TaxID=1936156 RepID=UPI003D9C560E